ncbi:MAG: hypothetical protein CL608_02505 [Anaerolineaceae bacterium]|nr:hypothetical protein [Anaerolineaceae bacterium]|tara:strand:- start:2373 stop:3296 length:924 start_codon:yes stop_codon:yes gene_type:complete
MEALLALRPDWSLQQMDDFVRQHNSNHNDAALALLDRVDCAVDDRFSKPIMPLEEKDVISAMDLAAPKMSRMHAFVDMKPDKRTQVFQNVQDGNCCPGALMQIVQLLADIPLARRKAEMELSAASMRETIFNYQLLNFERESFVTRQPWHEMIAMSHNIGITESETTEYGVWPASVEGRLERWIEERDDFYCTTSEIMAFYEMMVIKGLQIVIRVWRQNTGNSNLILLHTIPEAHASNSIIFDLKHTGKNDSARAHYQLLRSGSINFHKRAAPVNYEDMDYSDEGKSGKSKGKRPMKCSVSGGKRKK